MLLNENILDIYLAYEIRPVKGFCVAAVCLYINI